MRIVRRFSLLAALALAAVPLTATATGAQQISEFTVTVEEGRGRYRRARRPSPSTAPASAIRAAQVVDVLNFDAQGNPVASGADTDFAIEGGAWVLEGSPGSWLRVHLHRDDHRWRVVHRVDLRLHVRARLDARADADRARRLRCGSGRRRRPGRRHVPGLAGSVRAGVDGRVHQHVHHHAASAGPPAAQVVAQPAFTG